MNKRIKELIEKSTRVDVTEDRFGGTDYTSVFDKEKFAELIVGECAELAYKTSWDDLVHGYGQAVIPLHLHNTIKKHFGIKE